MRNKIGDKRCIPYYPDIKANKLDNDTIIGWFIGRRWIPNEPPIRNRVAIWDGKRWIYHHTEIHDKRPLEGRLP